MGTRLREFTRDDPSRIWTLLNEIRDFANRSGEVTHLVQTGDSSASSGYFYQVPWKVHDNVGPKNGINEIGVVPGVGIKFPEAGRYSIEVSHAWRTEGANPGTGIRNAWLMLNPASLATTSTTLIGGTILTQGTVNGGNGSNAVVRLTARRVDLKAGDVLTLQNWQNSGKNFFSYSDPSLSWMSIERVW